MNEWVKSSFSAIQRGINSVLEALTEHTVEVRQDFDDRSKQIYDLVLQGIKQNNMENQALMTAITTVSNQLTGLSTDVQNLVTGLNAKQSALASSLATANDKLTQLQVKGRPEDEQTITDLRAQLDNISVHNDDTDAVSQLNDIANRLSNLDGAIKQDTPVADPVTTETTPSATTETTPETAPVSEPETGTTTGTENPVS